MGDGADATVHGACIFEDHGNEKFEMSVGILGPTEARLAMILMNLMILGVGNPAVVWLTVPMTRLDVLGWLVAGLILNVLVPDVAKTMKELDWGDRGVWRM
jgi:hypothetical protein